MSKWTLKQIRDHHLGKVAYYTDEQCPRSAQRHQQIVNALSERIAADEASVPVAIASGGNLDLRLTLAEFSYTPPSGFSAWNRSLPIPSPAQPPIDLAAIREVIDGMETFLGSVDAWKVEINKLSRAIGDTP